MLQGGVFVMTLIGERKGPMKRLLKAARERWHKILFFVGCFRSCTFPQEPVSPYPVSSRPCDHIFRFQSIAPMISDPWPRAYPMPRTPPCLGCNTSPLYPPA